MVLVFGTTGYQPAIVVTGCPGNHILLMTLIPMLVDSDRNIHALALSLYPQLKNEIKHYTYMSWDTCVCNSISMFTLFQDHSIGLPYRSISSFFFTLESSTLHAERNTQTRMERNPSHMTKETKT